MRLEAAALEPNSVKRYNSAERKLARFLRSLGPEFEEEWGAWLRVPGSPGCGLFTPQSLRDFSASEELVCLFVEFSAEARYVFGTLKGDLNALRSRAVAFGVPAVPPLTPYARRLLAGYKKLLPGGERKRVPLSAPDYMSFMASLRMKEGEELECGLVEPGKQPPNRGTAEKERLSALFLAMLSAGFTGCLRAAEYTGLSLRCQDVTLSKAAADLLAELLCLAPTGRRRVVRERLSEPGNLFCVSLVLRKTKASPSAPVTVTLWAGLRDACPVGELLLYMAMRLRMQARCNGDYPFFASGRGAPIPRQAWAALLQSLAEMDGWSELKAAKLGPHSLRGGGATAASRGGAGELAVKALGRWKSDAVRGYVDASRVRSLEAQRAIAANLAEAWGAGGELGLL